MKTELVKGFSDYLGEEARKKAKVKEIIEKVFLKFGFEPAETPVVEYEEFVKGENQQDEAVSDIFKLEDKGKRKLALRYELTFPLKRISKQQKLPYRRYQIGPVFRDEPISANRFRQFTQADIDIIGSGLKEDAEIIMITSEIMEKLGIDAEIFFNNRKLLNEILEDKKIEEKNREEVIRIIDKLDKKSEQEILKELSEFKAEKVLEIIKDRKKCEKYASFKEIEEVEKYCRLFGVKAVFLPSLARGLSYYKGTVFEVKTKKIKETITGGGSYIFNGVQSTGISFGIERLMQLANIVNDKIDYLVVSIGKDKESIALAEKLRLKFNAQLMFDKSPSKALEYANSKKIDNIVFVGEEEVKSKKFKIKNLETGKERLVGEKEILK
jgi:histidyl-tRNA synthetase